MWSPGRRLVRSGLGTFIPNGRGCEPGKTGGVRGQARVGLNAAQKLIGPHRADEMTAGSETGLRIDQAYHRPRLDAWRLCGGLRALHAAEYRPDEGVARYHWPGQTWERSPAKLGTGSIKLRLGAV